MFLLTALGLTACGGDSDKDAKKTTGDAAKENRDDATSPDFTDGGDAPDPSSDENDSDSSDEADFTDGGDAFETNYGPDIDLCETISAEDIQAIIPDADPMTASENSVNPSTNCQYTIKIGDDNFSMDAAVILINWAGDEVTYNGQKELQQDTFDDFTEISELDTAFHYNFGGSIMLLDGEDAWSVLRGVEIDNKASRTVTTEELIEIAKLVEERLG